MREIFFLISIVVFVFSCGTHEKDIKEKNNSDEMYLMQKKDTLQGKDSLHSKIICPKCGFEKTELLPTDVCQLKYTCEACRYEIIPKEGDCCVFCSYGTVKCPSKQ